MTSSVFSVIQYKTVYKKTITIRNVTQAVNQTEDSAHNITDALAAVNITMTMQTIQVWEHHHDDADHTGMRTAVGCVLFTFPSEGNPIHWI